MVGPGAAGGEVDEERSAAIHCVCEGGATRARDASRGARFILIGSDNLICKEDISFYLVTGTGAFSFEFAPC